MTVLYNRKIELIVGNNKWTYPELQIEFNVSFDYDDEPNISEISIYNLNNDSVNSIKKGQQCVLNAGYNDDISTICAGVVYNVYTVKEGADIVTYLKVIDVQSQYLNSKISKTYNGPVNAEFLINDIFNQIGMKINTIDLNKNTIYQNGFNATGKVLDVIKRIAKDCQSKVIIKNNTISIVKDSVGFETGYLLTPETGLISIEPTKDSRTNVNYKIQSLLLNNVSTKSFIEVKSKYFNGVVMVAQGNHDNFITNLEVITVG